MLNMCPFSALCGHSNGAFVEGSRLPLWRNQALQNNLVEANVTLKSDPRQTLEADQEEEPSPTPAMAISTSPMLLLLLPLLASAEQGDLHGQPGGRALQWVGISLASRVWNHLISKYT